MLRLFYETVYIAVFLDEDERESLESIISYLKADAEVKIEDEKKGDTTGSRSCKYHVVVMLVDGEAVGGSLRLPGRPELRRHRVPARGAQPAGRGYGRRILEKTEQILHHDAARYSGKDLGWIMAEMDDPFVNRRPPDTFDGFTRAMIWNRWGYRAADFPYLQPALSERQQPVEHLLLLAKPLALSNPSRSKPSSRVQSALSADSVPSDEWRRRFAVLSLGDANRERRR